MKLNRNSCLVLIAMTSMTLSGHSQVKGGLKHSGNQANGQVVLSPRVAKIVRPILDIRKNSIQECGEVGTPSRCTTGEPYKKERSRQETLGRMLQRLIQQNTSASDEALVVLMCFQIGESQEEADTVISRGRRMLVYLKKYQFNIPVIRGTEYPKSIVKGSSLKKDDFEGAIEAIRRGQKNTAEGSQD